MTGGFYRRPSDNKSLTFSKTSQCSYSSHQCFHLNSLNPSTNVKFHQSLFYILWDCSKDSNYNWYHSHFMCHMFFSCLAKSEYLSSFFIFLNFHCILLEKQKSLIDDFFSSCRLQLGLLFWLTISYSLQLWVK